MKKRILQCLSLILCAARHGDRLENGGPEAEGAGNTHKEEADERKRIAAYEQQRHEAEDSVCNTGDDEHLLGVVLVGKLAGGNRGDDRSDYVDTEGKADLRVGKAGCSHYRIIKYVLYVRQKVHGRVEECAGHYAKEIP